MSGTASARKWRRALLVALALAAFAVELVPRVLNDPELDAWIDPIGYELGNAKVGPHPYLAYALKPGWTSRPTAKNSVSHNSLGFRGPETTWKKPDGVYRIVCLGGSSTYGFGPSSDETTWPARLEHHLSLARPEPRVEVINAGVEGYSTFESLVNLAFRVVELEPDLVVVYHTINDMRCALYPDPQPDNRHWRAVWPKERPSNLRSALEKSVLFRMARTHLTQYDEERSNLGGYVIVDFEGKKDKFARDEIPEMGFESFRRNLNHIITIARENGAKVMLVTQAFEREDLAGAPSEAAQLAAMERMTNMVRGVAGERSARLVDAAPVLEEAARRQLQESGSQDVFTRNVHLSDGGADLLARTIAAALTQ